MGIPNLGRHWLLVASFLVLAATWYESRAKYVKPAAFLEEIETSKLSSYRQFRDSVKPVMREWFTDELIFKQPRPFDWRFENGEYVLRLPWSSFIPTDGQNFQPKDWGLEPERLNLLLTINKDTSNKVIALPVKIEAQRYIIASVPEDHPAFVLFEHNAQGMAAYMGSMTELGYKRHTLKPDDNKQMIAYGYDIYARETNDETLDMVRAANQGTQAGAGYILFTVIFFGWAMLEFVSFQKTHRILGPTVNQGNNQPGSSQQAAKKFREKYGKGRR